MEGAEREAVMDNPMRLKSERGGIDVGEGDSAGVEEDCQSNECLGVIHNFAVGRMSVKLIWLCGGIPCQYEPSHCNRAATGAFFQIST